MASDGGWGYVIMDNDDQVLEGSGYLQQATNNVAELSAAIQGLKAAEQYINSNNIEDYEITLISDSMLVLNYANGSWRCKKEHLMPLRDELQALYKKLGASTKWVKGHSGHPQNERCDELAKSARAGKGQ